MIHLFTPTIHRLSYPFRQRLAAYKHVQQGAATLKAYEPNTIIYSTK